MQVYYDGEHSVRFTDPKADADKRLEPYPNGALRDSWTTFHLIPDSRPVIAPPPVKVNTIEVIGANSLIDLTEVPRGFPTYGNRTGNLSFYVDNSDPSYDWAKVYNDVKMYFHGQRLQMFLTDEASSYYEGRFEIDNWKTDKSISRISIKYDLDPYALSMFSTLEEWLWNPFDFLTMDIPVLQTDFMDLEVPEGSQTGSKTFSSEIVGYMPVIPVFHVKDSDETGMTIRVWNSFTQKWCKTIEGLKDTPSGGYVDPVVTFSTPTEGNVVYIEFSGVGKLSIDFRPGRL